MSGNWSISGEWEFTGTTTFSDDVAVTGDVTLSGEVEATKITDAVITANATDADKTITTASGVNQIHYNPDGVINLTRTWTLNNGVRLGQTMEFVNLEQSGGGNIRIAGTFIDQSGPIELVSPGAGGLQYRARLVWVTGGSPGWLQIGGGFS
jgi:Tfp pilus assembly protein FimT